MKITGTFERLRSNFWYLPTLYGIAAVLLALVTMQFDYFMTKHEKWLTYIPSVLLSDKDLAQTVLSSISTSLLTITTITFSSILVVLTTFLANFSPRTVQNFITDHSTQRVLGSFIGGFVYSVMLLLLLRKDDDQQLFLSPTFAIIVTIFCLAVFVFFVHHTASWIQVGNLIFNISSSTTKIIDEEYLNRGTERINEPFEEMNLDDIRMDNCFQVTAPVSGYIEFMDTNQLLKIASEHDVVIKVHKRQPDFTDKYSPLFTIWNGESKDLEALLQQSVVIGEQRAPYKDVEFGLRKLSEIALRAISPGINDPNTAINCIEQIGNILARLGKKQLPNPFHHDEEGQLKLIIKRPSFFDYLYLSFYQIRHYAKEDVSVNRSIIKALTIIAESNDNEIKEIVWEFSHYIIEGIDVEALLSLDKRYINELISELAHICNKEKECKLL
ncbi:DUF2254 domain-containing protein [Metabacillus iocasae]|uniref:Membrane protein n=1 Tax=Priestia iocasae TaxID=2291674 RepID=A0ABS2R0F6_9BACI|nr:DUF2254 domain-containing protein [Metabacillus iocasae]MBM7704737.1 putative membrane protein [Metabacillus iocasae]